MDDWLFISLAKTKAEAPNFKRKRTRAAYSKGETAAAMDAERMFERAGPRAVVALGVAALVNLAFLHAIERASVEAGAPQGEVIVAELDPAADLPVYAQVSATDRVSM